MILALPRVRVELLQQSDEGDKNVMSEGASGSTSRIGIMGGGECLICAASWVADVGDTLLRCVPVGGDPEGFCGDVGDTLLRCVADGGSPEGF